MLRRTVLGALASLAALAADSSFSAAARARTPAPPNAEAYIIWPPDGAVISGGKLWVRMGLRNMGICPKGVDLPNVGHHHLLVDASDPLKPGDVIPADRNHMHFGAGQTEARIELPPGKHTLQLVLGDAEHKVFNPPVVSKRVTITIY